MAAVADYSSKLVQISYAGLSISGFAADEFFNATRNADNTTSVVGADGRSGTAINPDRSGTVTITFQQNADANRILAAIQQEQDNTGIINRANITMLDPSGGQLATYKNCHIQRGADMAFSGGGSLTDRTWTFYCEEMLYVPTPDGLSQALADVVDTASAVELLNNVNEQLGLKLI